MVRTNRRNDKEFRYERVTIDSDSDDDRSALTRYDLKVTLQQQTSFPLFLLDELRCWSNIVKMQSWIHLA